MHTCVPLAQQPANPGAYSGRLSYSQPLAPCGSPRLRVPVEAFDERR